MQQSNADNQRRKPVSPAPTSEGPASHTHADETFGAEGTSAFESVIEAAKPHGLDVSGALNQGRIMEDEETDLTATSDDRLIALLCYWSQLVMPLIMPIIVLLSESGKRRPFQRHHAMQSLGLTGAVISLTIIATVGIGMLQVIPILGFVVAMLALCLSPIAYFMLVIAYVIYGWQANKGKRFSIPFLSRFLRNQGWLD